MICHLFFSAEVLESRDIGSYTVIDVINTCDLLKENKSIESSVVQFADTAANPKAMMVKFANASVTHTTMLGSEWNLVDTTDFASSILRDRDLLYLAK